MNQQPPVKQHSSAQPLPGGKVDPWDVLFEAFLVLLKHWKLLIIGPLIAGVVAYSGSFLLAKSYRSYAYVGPLDETLGKRSAALIQSPVVLDAAVRGLPEKLFSPIPANQSRAYVTQRIRFRPIDAADPKLQQLYIFEAVDSQPARAQAILTAVIGAWMTAMKPPPGKLASLDRMKEAFELQSANLSTAIATLMQHPELLRADVKTGYAPVNVGDLIKLRTDGIIKIEELKAAMAGLGDDIVVLPPTMPEASVGASRRLIVMLTVGITFVVLSGFLLVRGLFLPWLVNSAYGPKVRQLGDVIWRRSPAA
ncbi:hypothetical protein IVB30_11875 [Bradyrhizobium sp. 200]|uniref:hypothetical protein n=1 Tax=Bradyrhizobium sp. 200 TaxID=2782665 RepID=UPI001FFEB77E|nr:hypothetical protein [Bradyrhizobium sp. 200]UPJ51981.1 hypothetical protein IVB30_11875 [Bradyrhizobium sp. 200]